MCWIVHILILDWQVLCTAVYASVQHRISLYTPKSLHKEKIDRGRELERGRINGTLRYMYTHLRGIKSVSAETLSFTVLTDHQTATVAVELLSDDRFKTAQLRVTAETLLIPLKCVY